MFHALFGRHVADLKTSHWDKGRFVTRCEICGCDMVKLPGLPWQVASSRP